MTLKPEKGITPDRWIVVEIAKDGKTYRKLLSGWVGKTMSESTYRVSSVIEQETEKARAMHFDTKNGSTYICKNNREGMTALTSRAYESLTKEAQDVGFDVKLIVYGDPT